MADLQRKTANLYNTTETDWTLGILDDNGQPTGSTSSHYTTNYTEVLPQTAYVLSGTISTTGSLRVYFYSSDKSWISRTAQKTTGDFTTPQNCFYIRIQVTVTIEDTSDWMLNLGSTPLPYEPYGWVHSLRKLTTATEAIENPLYSDGTAITAYTLKGNTVQSGTPTPSNPVEVSGVGERTENLFYSSKNQTVGSTLHITQTIGNSSFVLNKDASQSDTSANIDLDVTLPAGTYTMSVIGLNLYNNDYDRVFLRDDDSTIVVQNVQTNRPQSFTLTETTHIYRATVVAAAQSTYDNTNISIMLVSGSTAPSTYIPYGFKIPISSVQTVNNYLGSIQSTRQIKKFVFDGTENWANAVASDIFGVANLFGNSPFIPQITALCTEYAYNPSQSGYASGLTSGEFALQKYTSGGNESYTPYFRNNSYTTVDQWKAYLQQQYAAGTPVTVWYVLKDEQTGIVNEPLMAIGTYYDSISNATAIPTTQGANSITVDTTVQPSEFSATWTGWHNASVKEWDGSQWQ